MLPMEAIRSEIMLPFPISRDRLQVAEAGSVHVNAVRLAVPSLTT